MIDLEPLTDFAAGYSKILDTFEQLKQLKPPKEADGIRAFEEWFREFQQTLLTLSEVPDAGLLVTFGEELVALLARIAGTDAPQPPPEEEALLSVPMPDGDADNEMLKWDQTTDKAWAIQDAPDTAFKVLQRKADGTIGWDWLRAH